MESPWKVCKIYLVIKHIIFYSTILNKNQEKSVRMAISVQVDCFVLFFFVFVKNPMSMDRHVRGLHHPTFLPTQIWRDCPKQNFENLQDKISTKTRSITTTPLLSPKKVSFLLMMILFLDTSVLFYSYYVDCCIILPWDSKVKEEKKA